MAETERKRTAHEPGTKGDYTRSRREIHMQDELPLGTHLVTPRLGYLHHGIYAGEGRVIHYAGFDRWWHHGPVEEVPLQFFTLGHALQVKASAAAKFDGPQRIARARSRLGEDRYRLWSNNCEHFAEWVVNGVSRSPQLDAWRSRFARPLARAYALLNGRAASPAAPRAGAVRGRA